MTFVSIFHYRIEMFVRFKIYFVLLVYLKFIKIDNRTTMNAFFVLSKDRTWNCNAENFLKIQKKTPRIAYNFFSSKMHRNRTKKKAFIIFIKNSYLNNWDLFIYNNNDNYL